MMISYDYYYSHDTILILMSTLQKRYGSGYLWSSKIKDASQLKVLLPMFNVYDINHHRPQTIQVV